MRVPWSPAASHLAGGLILSPGPALAQEAGMDPVHMALAWHRTRPFRSVPIFGATSVEQLSRILAGLEAEVSPELARRIDEVNKAHPLPY